MARLTDRPNLVASICWLLRRRHSFENVPSFALTRDMPYTGTRYPFGVTCTPACGARPRVRPAGASSQNTSAHTAASESVKRR